MNPTQPSPGIYQDAFLAKLSPDGKSLLFSTYYGGDWAAANAVAVFADASLALSSR